MIKINLFYESLILETPPNTSQAKTQLQPMEFSNSDEFDELRRVLTRKKIMLQQKELFIFNTIYFSFSVMYTFVEYVYIYIYNTTESFAIILSTI